MQASYASPHIPLSRTSTGQGRDSISSLEQRPRTFSNNGRAMTTPNLSLSIPVTEQVNGSTKYIISSHGDVMPQEEEKDGDEDSDVSSICHSPGWDDLSGKKRKKEKKEKERRRREKEKLDRTKLSKPPPANRRLSKVAIMMDRSTSAPAVPALHEVKEPGEVKKKSAERARRGSIDIGFRSLMGVKKAWKSSHTTPTTSAEEVPPIPTSAPQSKEGFIGGLKLRQSQEATTQEALKRLKLAMEPDGKGLLDSYREDMAAKAGGGSSGTSLVESTTRATSIYEESIRTPSQWDSIYAQAALLASTPGDRISDEKLVDDDTPIMERNIRKSRKAHPPTSRYFDNDDARSGRNQSSRASFRSSLQSEGSSAGGRPSSAVSPAIENSNYPTEPNEEATRGRSTSYVDHSRQRSHDQSVKDFQENNLVSGGSSKPKKSESRGRSILSRSKSRTRMSSNARPGTAGSGSGKELTNPFSSKDDPVSQLHFGQTTESPTESAFSHRHKSSFASSHGIKGLRNAARAAFSSKSVVSVDSGSENYQSSAEIVTATSHRPQDAKRAAAVDAPAPSPTPPSKPERVLGETIPPVLVQDFAHPPRFTGRFSTTQGVAPAARNLGASSSSKTTKSRNRAHSSSSEEYSTPDEFSNVTTPAMYRPHSEKEYFPNMDSINGNSKKNTSTSSVNHPQDPYLMTGAIQSEETIGSSREDWSRTVMPMEMTEDEGGEKTPIPTPDNGVPPVPQLPDGLNRQPSLSRSISTPELQDLSFLPALKHQALAPRPKEKSRQKKKSKSESNAHKTQSSSTSSLPQPPPLSPPTTKSEGSSPTSPVSSQHQQYLRNARLSLPRPAAKPSTSKAGQFGHPPHAPGPGGPEPIAKMFVVCCSCKYFHDMPSKIYECMAKPDNIVRDTALGVSGVVSTAVKCPWCGHGMSTKCCAGYAGVVYLRERFH